MKQNEHIDNLFENLKDTWDVEQPSEGHQARFLEKLQTKDKVVSIAKKSKPFPWKWLSVASAVVVLLGVGISVFKTENTQQIAQEPTEIEKTEYYFATLINEEIEKIEAEATPETKEIIADAMLQIKKLEKDHKKLEEDLANEGNSKQILHAMIINYQTRINLLQDVLEQIEEIKQLKNIQNEHQII
ncbi:hypothetical protein [Joostella sp. CR20]|uniref:hypothetical protein n=1 Tax=Joostella sp. CR20 TaxID=2804312 RepID=UPI00313D02FF